MFGLNSVNILVPDEVWQIRVQNSDKVNEYKVFVTESQLLILTQIAQENAAQC